ncbi:TPA: DUF6402 family protein [Photobacterium damselae]
MSVSTSVLSHKSNTQGKEVLVDVFHITDIPNAMRKMGWEVAPQLMEYWFNNELNEFTQESKLKMFEGDARTIPVKLVNTFIVKMEWARNYTQVKNGIDYLIEHWDSPAGIKQLKKRLKQAGWDGKNTIFLGRNESVIVQDACYQINFKSIGGFFDEINDWYGAIGNANLKVTVQGFSTIFDNKAFFVVEKIGFYLKDTYDFLSDKKWTKFGLSEPLGIWSESGILDKAKSALYIDSYTKGLFGYLAREFSGYVPVTNSDFRSWQKKHNAGGDYIVFSDIYWLDPLPNQKLIEL